MTTKDRIEHEALNFFSVKGYSASSVRNICSAVGIKESVIYYYFKNKKAILDTLEQNFVDTAKKTINDMKNALDVIQTVDENSFVDIINGFVDGYLRKPFIHKFTRILMIEQYGNADLRKIYHTWLMEQPLSYFKDLFKKLIGLSFIESYNTDFYAMSCYTPVFFYFQEHLMFDNVKPDDKMRYGMKVKQYLGKFLDKYQAK